MSDIVIVTAKKIVNNQEINCNYMTTKQGDGWIYFNDAEFYRYNQETSNLQINEKRYRWVDTGQLWDINIANANIENINTVIDSSPNVPTGQFIEDMINFAVSKANDPRCGYDQANRLGPDYDCSSLVGFSINAAGEYVNVNNFATSTMRQLMPSTFEFLGRSIVDETNLVRGDILWVNHVFNGVQYGHTGIYLGNSQIVEARINELGTITGGQTGDQTGNEIRISPFYAYGYGGADFPHWDGLFRYVG